MPKPKKLTAKHCAGGLDVGTGIFNLKPEQNVETRNMEYSINGAAQSSLGYGDPGWDWGENDVGIDGLHRVALYPDLIFAAVNGKIKYVDATTAPQSSGAVYNTDSAISLTAGNPVFMKDYRGMLYFCNGVENLGRIAIGQLYSELATTPSTFTEVIADSGTSYVWTISGSGTNEYYCRATGPENPKFGTPVTVTINSVTATEGTVGSLTAGQWDYADNDSLGYSTIYVRLSDGTDPDTKSTGYVQAAFRALYLKPAEGYRFTNGTDKVYVEGDEVDYMKEIDGTTTDKLTGVTNVASTHAVNAYVTQYNTLAQSYQPKCIAFFRDTMWIAGMPNEPGVLRYGKTIGTVGNLTSGNLHDFSDGNNYIIGDGGEITALQSTENRLYVFMKDKVHFIPIVYDTNGAQIFDVSHLFTGVYGCPNAFCVTEMEDVVIFFTGKRLIRIGYDPNGQTLIPDESFDREILPLLQDADEDQTDARITYNPSEKILRIKYMVNGVAKVIKYHKQLDKYSAFSDEDASCYVVHRRNTYFGDNNNDKTWKIGADIDSEGENTAHRYLTGRIDGGNKNWKFFKKGVVRGQKNIGGALYVLTKVDNKDVGAARLIPEAAMDLTAEATPLGEAVTGGDEIGLSGDTNNLFPYTYHFLIGKRGKDYSFAISSDDSGAVWNMDGFEVEWEEFDAEPRTHY